MVKVILKGMKYSLERNGNYTFKIAEFKAGLILLESGGVQITLSNKELSEKLDLFFKKCEKEKLPKK